MRRHRTEATWLRGWVRANGWVWRGNDYMECPVCAALVIIDAAASDKHTRSHGIDPKTQWRDHKPAAELRGDPRVKVSLFNVETMLARARAGIDPCGWCEQDALTAECAEYIRMAAEQGQP